MSWTGGMFEYPVTMDKKKIELDVNDSLYQERGAMEPCFQPFVWRDNVVLESREDAEEWLENPANMSRYWRNKNVAIQYIHRERVKTKKEAELEDRIIELKKKRDIYISEHMAGKTAHAFIGCPNCGSKLSSKHLSGNKCPLCNAELRSQTVLNTIARYQERIAEAQKAWRDEKKRPKRGDKEVKMWLINAEAYLG